MTWLDVGRSKSQHDFEVAKAATLTLGHRSPSFCYFMLKTVKSYQALGLELIPVYRQSAHMWRLYVIHSAVGCHYLFARPAAAEHPALGRYQVMLLGDRCTQVWTTCPTLLSSFALSWIWIHDLLIASPTMLSVC